MDRDSSIHDELALLREQIAQLHHATTTREMLPSGPPLWPYIVFGLIAGPVLFAAGAMFMLWLSR